MLLNLLGRVRIHSYCSRMGRGGLQGTRGCDVINEIGRESRNDGRGQQRSGMTGKLPRCFNRLTINYSFSRGFFVAKLC
jgi:hypothetical protein